MSDFLIDINPDIELPKYELVLTKLTEEPITSLKNITDLEYNAFYVGIDELNFNVPFYRTEDNGDKVENEIYNLVEGDCLILVNDMKYFIINSVVEKADESGKVWKEVHCYSREYELSKKKLIDYKADSRLLYDDSNSMLDGLEKGILNYIFNHIVKSWTIGYVDPDVILREGKGIYRSLNFSNSNLIQVFNDLQRTYGCVFKFDTIKQEMNICSIDNMMGQHRGLYISDGNFIKNISKDINTDEIITRLYIYGKDNISIQSISPTGLPYIDNLNYYKNTLNKNGQPKYMTQDLIDALDSYYTKVENYNPDFEPLLIRLQEANAVMEDLINADHIDDLTQKGLVALERYLSNLQTLIDVKTEEIAIIKNQITKATGENLIGLYNDLRATESALDSYNTDKDNVNNLIVAKKTEINNQQQIIDGIESELKVLQDELSVSNSTNFTDEQLKELDKFIKVDIYNNSDYTENNIQELYDEGKKILDKASQPKIQFDVDVVDFLSLVECQHIWDKFTLGDIVTLEHRAIGFNYDVRLVGYEYNIDDNNLTLKFSNTDSFDDASLYLENLLDDFNTTGAVVDFNKDKWNNVGSIESRIAKMVDTKLEEARQNILNAVGQRYLFDDSGLWLYKENPDGTLNNEQIRAINNTIALTDDNWNTIKTAITPQGVVAEQIYGKIVKGAQVSADCIVVGENGETIPDEALGGSLVKQNFDYNGTKITQQEGIEVYDNLGNRVLQTGSFDSDGDGVKDMFGHVAYHYNPDGTSNGYSALVGEGFIRGYKYGEAAYLNDIWIYQGIYSGAQFNGPTLLRIDLPERFRGRANKVKIILTPTRIDNSGLSQYELYLWKLNVVLEAYSIIITDTQAYVQIYAYIKQEHHGENSSEVKIDYHGLDFDLIAIGE